jgi:hypothetical protein
MKFIHLATAAIVACAQRIVRENDYDTRDDPIDARRIGHLMRKLRFEADRTNASRQWRVSLDHLAKLSRSYGLNLPARLAAEVDQTPMQEQSSQEKAVSEQDTPDPINGARPTNGINEPPED